MRKNVANRVATGNKPNAEEIGILSSNTADKCFWGQVGLCTLPAHITCVTCCKIMEMIERACIWAYICGHPSVGVYMQEFVCGLLYVGVFFVGVYMWARLFGEYVKGVERVYMCVFLCTQMVKELAGLQCTTTEQGLVFKADPTPKELKE